MKQAGKIWVLLPKEFVLDNMRPLPSGNSYKAQANKKGA